MNNFIALGIKVYGTTLQVEYEKWVIVWTISMEYHNMYVTWKETELVSFASELYMHIIGGGVASN